MKHIFYSLLLFCSVALLPACGETSQPTKAPETEEPAAEEVLEDDFYKNADALAATYDTNNTVKEPMREDIFALYRDRQWSDLEKLFDQNKLNSGYPPGYGGYNTEMTALTAGMKFDRYEKTYRGGVMDGFPVLNGQFFSPLTNPPVGYPQRALQGDEDTYDLYYTVEVVKDLEFQGEQSTIIPWFGQPGEGIQVKWNSPNDGKYPISLTKLALQGYLKITIVSSPDGKQQKLTGKVIEKQ